MGLDVPLPVLLVRAAPRPLRPRHDRRGGLPRRPRPAPSESIPSPLLPPSVLPSAHEPEGEPVLGRHPPRHRLEQLPRQPRPPVRRLALPLEAVQEGDKTLEGLLRQCDAIEQEFLLRDRSLLR